MGTYGASANKRGRSRFAVKRAAPVCRNAVRRISAQSRRAEISRQVRSRQCHEQTGLQKVLRRGRYDRRTIRQRKRQMGEAAAGNREKIDRMFPPRGKSAKGKFTAGI